MYNRGTREGLKGTKNILALTVLTKCLKGENKPKVMMFSHPINVLLSFMQHLPTNCGNKPISRGFPTIPTLLNSSLVIFATTITISRIRKIDFSLASSSSGSLHVTSLRRSLVSTVLYTSYGMNANIYIAFLNNIF